MYGTIISTYLFRVTDALTLSHPSKFGARHRLRNTRTPAVLVIPRSGRIRDPYLVVQEVACADYNGCPIGSFKGLASVDVHVRARIGGFHDRSWQEVADVLVCPSGWPRGLSPEQMAHFFGQFPGCDVLIGRHQKGCVLGLRDGRMVTVTGSAIFPAFGDTAWPGVYGSVLHCWLAAGVPLGTVEDATVIAAHVDPATGGVDHLAVAARTLLHVTCHGARRHSIGRPVSS